jgi:hypothetical protein
LPPTISADKKIAAIGFSRTQKKLNGKKNFAVKSFFFQTLPSALSQKHSGFGQVGAPRRKRRQAAKPNAPARCYGRLIN